MTSLARPLWEASDDATLTALWPEEGVSVEDIAKRVGRTVKAVRARAKLLKLGRRPFVPDFWTEARVKVLTDGVKAGLSYATIGAQLGCTRSACIGYAHRNGVEQPSWKIQQAASRVAARVPRPPRAPKPAPPPRAVKPRSEKVVRMLLLDKFDRHDAFRPLPNTTPATLMARTGCCWPVGEDEGGHLFCDEPNSGLTYCPTHLALKFVPPQPRKAKAKPDYRTAEGKRWAA